ncbi:MAG: diguanylate cyclase [Dissulfurimicrobium sp.]|uniref:GGDEF domain-containing protein n=1 Tax=Dissulfurimicrobium sp. TaxID=2022436 RepID=UPI003D115253
MANFKKQNDLCIVSLKDISRERKLIEDYFFLRKELTAKTILEEYKTKQLKILQERLEILFDHLPDGLAIIGLDHTIIESNLFLKEKLSQKYPAKSYVKCFEIFGYKDPCRQCPITETSQNRFQLIGHEREGEHITENFIPIANQSGALLVFKDDTNKVKLIKQIKAQQRQLNEQKDLFVELSGLMLLMQQPGEDETKLAHTVLSSILSKIGGTKCFLLIEDIRRGVIWLQISIGLEHDCAQGLIGSYLSHLPRKCDTFVFPLEALPPASDGGDRTWFQMPLRSNKGEQIGILLLNQGRVSSMHECDLDANNIIDLYSKSFLSWIQNKLLLKRLEERANIDGLTGLYNRYYFERALSEEISKNAGHGIHFSVIVADLNGLKFINDVYGHQAGDELIRAAAAILCKNVRETDVLARIGGDEFYILLPNTTSGNAVNLLNRIKETFNDKELPVAEGVSVPISVSLGSASSDLVPPDEVVKAADNAMYADKDRYYADHKRYR